MGFLSGLASGIIGGIGNIFGAGKQRKHEENVNNQNIAFQKQQNRENQDFQMSMYDKQNADNVKFWNMQNAYNDPSAQMQRLKDANLNPNLAYGNGSVANTNSSAIQTASAPTWQGEAPKVQKGQRGQEFMQISTALSSIYALEQQKANIAKTDAEKDSINAQTFGVKFNNQFLNPEIADLMFHDKKNYLFHNAKRHQHQEQHDYFKALGLQREELNNKFLSGEMHPDQAKDHQYGNFLIKDRIQQSNNLKAMGDESTSRAWLNKIEANLLQKGLNKNSSPIWKIGMDLFDFVRKNKNNEEKAERHFGKYK